MLKSLRIAPIVFLLIFMVGCSSDDSMVSSDLLSADLLAQEDAFYAQREVRSLWQNEIKNTQSLEAHFKIGCPLDGLILDKLYPPTTIPANNSDEVSFIAEFLKFNDFKVAGQGRGNWLNGPRIVTLDLEKNDCQCQVHKRYYAPRVDDQHFVTEEVSCRLWCEHGPCASLGEIPNL